MIRAAASGLSLPAGVTLGVLASLGLAAVAAAAIAVSRSMGRDPLERVASWASRAGLAYCPPVPDAPNVLALFAGADAGLRVALEVRRLPSRALADLPPQLTTLTVGEPGGAEALVQPAAWVMTVTGAEPGGRRLTGDAAFDAAWAAYGDAGCEALVTPAVRERLALPDAAVTAVTLTATSASASVPGVPSPRELDRLLGLLSDLAAAA